MRKIGVITTSRADYGIYLPILKKIKAHSELRPLVYVTGAHLSEKFGNTVNLIKKDGFPISMQVKIPLSDTPEGIAKAMGACTDGFAGVYKETKPDIVMALGDRYEMLAAAMAAVPFNIPIAHVHGGESTIGLIDESFRHALTKISHLHFTATKEFADRIIRMGEDPWRVVVTGAPALDNILSIQRLSKAELARRFGLAAEKPFLLATFHPVTTAVERTGAYIGNLLEALADFRDHQIVFTLPNADTAASVILREIKAFVKSHENARFVDNFGPQGYLSAMEHAVAMVGNSSSGIVEAASFKLPVVNVGHRQEGRLKSRNVIDVGYGIGEIKEALRLALAPDFRARLGNLTNPYGDGRASDRIVKVLAEVGIKRLIPKMFYKPSS